MDRTTQELLKFSIKKYWKEKSDAELALSLGVTEEDIRTMRVKMNLIPDKGNESLKEFARRYILEMPEREKREFMKQLPADLVWKMSEGNPHSSEDSTVKHIPPTPIMALPS